MGCVMASVWAPRSASHAGDPKLPPISARVTSTSYWRARSNWRWSRDRSKTPGDGSRSAQVTRTRMPSTKGSWATEASTESEFALVGGQLQ